MLCNMYYKVKYLDFKLIIKKDSEKLLYYSKLFDKVRYFKNFCSCNKTYYYELVY